MFTCQAREGLHPATPSSLPVASLFPVGTLVFFCQKAPACKAIYRPFAWLGLSALLIDVFIKNPGPIDSCVVQKIPTTFSTYVKAESDLGFNQLVFSSDRKNVKVQEIQLVLLQLFAARILEPKLVGKQLCCALMTDASGNPNLSNDAFWVGMSLLEA